MKKPYFKRVDRRTEVGPQCSIAINGNPLSNNDAWIDGTGMELSCSGDAVIAKGGGKTLVFPFSAPNHFFIQVSRQGAAGQQCCLAFDGRPPADDANWVDGEEMRIECLDKGIMIYGRTGGPIVIPWPKN